MDSTLSYQSIAQRVLTEGVSVFPNEISPSQIQLLIQEINQIKKRVMEKVETMERPIKTYSDIAERHLGRLDYRCGFTADIFQQVAHPIVNIIKKISPTVDFNHYWGVITSLPGSGPTNMHRDVYSLLNTPEDQNLDCLDIQLPPYYFTVLIPLVEITKDNGPTAFIKKSHLHHAVNISESQLFAPLTKPGDFIVFDGRTLHQGLSNNTKEERLIAYITFIANWYHDQTFVINNYLFPELAIKGE